MYTLVKPVKIVLRKHGVVITKETLAADQSLADLVLNDADLNKRYGHNFKKLGNKEPEGEVVIPVNIKKKAESELKTSGESASTSSQAPTSEPQKQAQQGGMNLNVSEQKPESQLKDLQQSKQGTTNQKEQGVSHSKGKRLDVSGATRE